MKRVLTVLIVLLLFSSCSLFRRTVTKNTTTDYDKQTETTITKTTVRDTIIAEKKVTVHDENLLNHYSLRGDSLSKQQLYIDSIELAIALQDERIRSLTRQISKNQFMIPPISVNEPYVYAEAGVTNNELWLNLLQRNVVHEYEKSDTTITIKESKNTETNIETVLEKRWYSNIWFWVALLLGVISILLLALIVQTKIRR